MREIKFRTWDKIKLEMITSGLEYQKRCLGLIKGDPGIEQGMEDYDGFGFTEHEHERFNVMQFTGLKDKSDIEIFESDIMEIRFHNHTVRTGVVKWFQHHTHFSIDVYKSTDLTLGSHSISFGGSKVDGQYIIGNIYENPELLKN